MPSRRVRSSVRQLMIETDKKAREELFNTSVQYGITKANHFRRVTSDWSGKPKFDVRSKVTPKMIQVTIEVRGEHKDKWFWVDLGTGSHVPGGKPYLILPVKAPVLKFQTGHNPRTKPIARFNQGDGKASGGWVSTGMVVHPGIKGRKFDETWDEDHIIQFRRDLENAIRRGVRRSQ